MDRQQWSSRSGGGSSREGSSSSSRRGGGVGPSGGRGRSRYNPAATTDYIKPTSIPVKLNCFPVSIIDDNKNKEGGRMLCMYDIQIYQVKYVRKQKMDVHGNFEAVGSTTNPDKPYTIERIVLDNTYLTTLTSSSDTTTAAATSNNRFRINPMLQKAQFVGTSNELTRRILKQLTFDLWNDKKMKYDDDEEQPGRPSSTYIEFWEEQQQEQQETQHQPHRPQLFLVRSLCM